MVGKRAAVARRTIANKSSASAWPCDIEVTRIPVATVSLLIGNDLSAAHLPFEHRSGTDVEPCALKIALGWVVRRPREPTRGHVEVLNGHVVCKPVLSVNDDLGSQVKAYFEADFSEG